MYVCSEDEGWIHRSLVLLRRWPSPHDWWVSRGLAVGTSYLGEWMCGTGACYTCRLVMGIGAIARER
jgi:hypothetical protein